MRFQGRLRALNRPRSGGEGMTDAVFLIIYFLSYAAGFAALIITLFAILKGAPPIMKTYFVFLLSSVFFLLVRNMGFFAKMFLGILNIEQTVFFYVIYMVSCGALNFSYIGLAMELKFERRRAFGVFVACAVAAVPLAYIPLLAVSMKEEYPGIARLAFMYDMMHFTYDTVVLGIIFLLFFRWWIKDAFKRRLTDAILVNGALYVLMGTLQWLTYRDLNYSVGVFSVINVNMSLLFLSGAYLVGREFLMPESRGVKSPEGAVSMPELTPIENKIVEGIRKGKKNKEIADELGLTLARVKNANYRIFSRFRVGSRTELISVLGRYEGRLSAGGLGGRGHGAAPGSGNG
jgi:DNA-binding CsgD family transcriptional regulator